MTEPKDGSTTPNEIEEEVPCYFNHDEGIWVYRIGPSDSYKFWPYEQNKSKWKDKRKWENEND